MSHSNIKDAGVQRVSEKRLRDIIRKELNGEYAISICLCGSFRSDPDGNTSTCSFTSKCSNCIDWDEYKI